jgi:hypothetical protein
MGSIGAVRFISIDVGSYKLFSNVWTSECVPAVIV